MNPLTNVKNVNKMNQRELELGVAGTSTSWHAQYKDSAWVFVGGLPYDLSEGDVLCVFSQYGEIVNINMVRDPKTGKPRGFCFICYEDQRSTILTVDNLNGIKILNRTIRVDHVNDYKPPKEQEDMDEMTRKMREEGCAPTIAESEPEHSDGDQLVLPIKKVKKEKKSKKEKKKKRKKKSKKGDSSSSDSDCSNSDGKLQKHPAVKIKAERHDLKAADSLHDVNRKGTSGFYPSRRRKDAHSPSPGRRRKRMESYSSDEPESYSRGPQRKDGSGREGASQHLALHAKRRPARSPSPNVRRKRRGDSSSEDYDRYSGRGGQGDVAVKRLASRSSSPYPRSRRRQSSSPEDHSMRPRGAGSWGDSRSPSPYARRKPRQSSSSEDSVGDSRRGSSRDVTGHKGRSPNRDRYQCNEKDRGRNGNRNSSRERKNRQSPESAKYSKRSTNPEDKFGRDVDHLRRHRDSGSDYH